MESSQPEVGLEYARSFLREKDGAWTDYFEHLRSRRQLSVAIREINALLQHPVHRCEAEAALKHVGLWNA
jgi:hypothetical protein